MIETLAPANSELGNQNTLQLEDRGLYCPRGGFVIDPLLPVELAVITHAHGDHARMGSGEYICSRECAPLLLQRLGPETKIRALAYGEKIRLGEATLSLHPAGHILGSAQARVEVGGEVWVASGDYKRAHDPTCAPFEVVPCDVFITEATFALPIYRWDSGEEVARQILAWWDENIRAQRPSLLFCYALGKAQRVLAEIRKLDPSRHVYVHGAVHTLTELYRKSGIDMVDTTLIGESTKGQSFAGELILAPPSAYRSPWMKRFKGADTGFASGWMRVRGHRRRRGYDRGFVLSDHADWNDLIRTVKETGARIVLPTHGGVDVLSRYLNEQGIRATPLHIAGYGDDKEGD